MRRLGILVLVFSASFLSLWSKTAVAQFRRAICCPHTPMELCDFHFRGYEFSLPSFYLDDGIHGDHAVSPIDVNKLGWRGSIEKFSPEVMDSISRQIVMVFSTNLNGTFLNCPIPNPDWINPGDQFYMSGSSDNIGRLWARTWQKKTATQWGKDFYKNRCILLPLTGVQIPKQYGVINLNPRDGNANYTESRRCVVFRTRG